MLLVENKISKSFVYRVKTKRDNEKWAFVLVQEIN